MAVRVLVAVDADQAAGDGVGVGDVATLTGENLHVADHAGMHLMIRSNDDDIGMFNVSDVFSSNGVIHVIDAVLVP